MHEYHALRGRVTVHLVDRHGRARDRIVVQNAIVDSGRNLISQLLVGAEGAAPISHLAVGTSAAAPTPADTQLGAEITTIDRAALTIEPLSGASIGLRVGAQISSETSQAVAEAAIFNAAGHGAGVMYNRVVFPTPVPVGTDLDLIFEWDITF